MYIIYIVSLNDKLINNPDLFYIKLVHAMYIIYLVSLNDKLINNPDLFYIKLVLEHKKWRFEHFSAF